jgi:tetratricopeptide (TPR) repeat protein
LTTFPDRKAEAYSVLGHFYQATNRPEEAMAAWNAGLAADPTSHELQLALLRAQLASDDPNVLQQGRDRLEKAFTQQPDDPELMLLRADQLVHRGDPDGLRTATALLQQLLQREPDNMQAHTLIVRAARLRGAADEARKLIATARAANADYPPLLVEQALFEMSVGRIDAAERAAKEALRVDPNNISARNVLVEASIRSHDLDAAERYNTEILERDLTDEPANIARALIAIARNQPDQAVASLEAFEKTPAGQRSVRAKVVLSDLYRSRKTFDKAEPLIEAATTLAPNDLMVLTARLQWLAAQDRYDQIVSWLDKHQNAYAEKGRALLIGATILTSSGKPKQLSAARELFEQAAHELPTPIPAYAGIARTYFMEGDYERAVNAYRRVLAIEPLHAETLNDLAWILSTKLNRSSEALDLANTGVARHPDDPHLLDTRAMILIALDRPADAQKDLQRCLGLADTPATTRASALRQLGLLEAKQKDTESARKHLTEAMELDKKLDVFDQSERAEMQTVLDSLSSTS